LKSSVTSSASPSTLRLDANNADASPGPLDVATGRFAPFVVAVVNAPFVEGVVVEGVVVVADGRALNVLSQNFFASSRLGAPSPVDASVDAGVIVPNRTKPNRTEPNLTQTNANSPPSPPPPSLALA
jgi:hypothetical protein